MTVVGRLIGSLLKRGQITLITPDGKRASYGPGSGKSLTIRVTDRRVLFELVRNPRLAIGETYMNGRLMIEDGTILDLLEMVVGNNPWEDGGNNRKVIKKGKKRFKWLFHRNRAGRSKRNVAHHYDLKDELYELFLDDDRQYSCAYFTDPSNSLEQAQADKKAHIAAKLNLKSGQRVLDIGCGWGGMALYLHRVAGVDVTGITLSEEQLKVARRRAEEAGVSDHVRFELIDYRSVSGTFDRIVSIGMFEHVGAPHYVEFFAKCRELLAEDGVMLLHTIGKYGGAGAPDPFTDKYIFPGYHVPSLAQMVSASEKVRLIASDVETLRLHYGYTLRNWLQRATEARAQIVAMYDERFFRMWEFYLAGGIVAFENGAMNNYQIQYIRNRRALPITRDYMIDDERRLRAGGIEKARRSAPGPRRAKAKETA
jgi:cyclopropane-fatty-acyl-phospholipid synthase